MKKLTNAQLDEIIAKILNGVENEHGQYRAFAEALQSELEPDSRAWVAGSEVGLEGFGYDSNPRRGVTARCVGGNGKLYRISAADVDVADNAAGSHYLAAYRRWLGLTPYLPAGAPAAQQLKQQQVELLLMAPIKDALRCRVKDSGQMVTLRLLGRHAVVPGETLMVEITKVYTRAGHDLLTGRLKHAAIDAKALQLTPLQLRDEGMWDPEEHYWGEEGEALPKWATAQKIWGPRPEYEMEQVLPGEDPEDMDSDPIIRAMDFAAARQRKPAFEILYELCLADLRCLDAHAHLGNLWFDTNPALALRHYEVGVRIGELSLGEGFQGVLHWGMIDNRPFLRCLNGYGLCLWRLQRFEEARQVFDRMLWMNPTDNQGVRLIIDDVAANRPWHDDY